MRIAAAGFVAVMCLTLTVACTRTPPPVGRWQGTYQSPDTLVVTRLEIDSKGNIYLSAPDATGVANASADDRMVIRQRLAEGLSIAWGEAQPRQFDFDGRVFRKPGGFAPQLEWNPDSRTMTAVVYLGMRSAIRIPLHPVRQFSSDPWTG